MFLLSVGFPKSLSPGTQTLIKTPEPETSESLCDLCPYRQNQIFHHKLQTQMKARYPACMHTADLYIPA